MKGSSETNGLAQARRTKMTGGGSGVSKAGILVMATMTAAIVIGVLSVGASGAVAAPTASARTATAYKCAFFGTGIKGPIRNGQFCATIAGTGLFVSTVTASFGFVVPVLNQVCLPSMKIDFYDSSGRWYAWKPGGQVGRCFNSGAVISVPSIGLNQYFRTGSARVTLLSAGSTVAEIWYGIH